MIQSFGFVSYWEIESKKEKSPFIGMINVSISFDHRNGLGFSINR